MKILCLIKGSWIIALLCSHVSVRSVTTDFTVNNSIEEDNISHSQTQRKNLIGYWKFDAVEDNRTKDEATGMMDFVEGNYKLVEGVKGKALKCDGFTTTIIRDVEEMPEISGAFSIEAWIAPQAYPWNWCAIVNQEYEHQRGFFFGIDAEGRIGFHAAVARQWRECISDIKIPFMEWSHVVATFDPELGISLFINGENAGFLEVSGDLLNDFEKDLQIARNHRLTIPASLNRGGFSRVPASYSFDGLIDELKIYPEVLSPDEIRNTFIQHTPVNEPDLKWRRLPAINTNNSDFGAYYTRLEYDEDWDALWKDDRYPDIVVTFPGEDYSMVFWKGTNYNLNLVTENGKWIGDQSVETFGRMGCMEHMSDKQNRYSHVRIIENHSARVVVHWRYALTDITYRIANINPVTNWGDWVDEYYYIYPDGIAIRHFIIHGVTDEDEYSVTEPTLFSNPGEKPEDNIM
ncbi:MAG: LamG domain-containing protein, partial [Bacteroidales bacterium]|nr:LamG domain-containing protein [Bacteroidales bacterium]